jgi:hypothetical protein
MRYALALLLLSLSSLAAGVDYDDVARIDFPARDRTVFLAGCYSMHTENVFAGFNCADSIDVTEHEHYKSFALVCYDDVIFRDGFEPQP